MRLATLTTSAVMALLAPMGAQAQTQSDTPPTAGNAASGGLEEVVVTAQRREESAQRAAVPMNVVRGEDLINAGATQIERLNEMAPALTVQPSSTGNLLFIRGVGNFTLTPNSDPANAFNYDGVYVGRPTSTTGAFFDLDRVEILKGPQGILYGRNSTGGAINVIPTRPQLGEYSGYATTSFGNYSAVTAEGALNLPLGDKSAFRISASTSQHDGYLKDGTSDDDTTSARVQFRTDITPDFNVRIAADYSHTGGAGGGVSYLGSYVPAGPTGYTYVPANLPIDLGVFSPAAQAYRQTRPAGPAGRFFDALGPYPFQNNNFSGVYAEINYTTPLGALTIIPAHREADLDILSSAAAFGYRQREKDKQDSLEARLAGTNGAFDYVAGIYYFHEDIDSHLALSLSAQGSFLHEMLETESFAPFGEITAHLSDRLRLIAGVRYTHDDKSFRGPTTSFNVVCLTNPATPCPAAPLFPLVDDPSQIPFPVPAAGGLPLIGTTDPNAIIVRSDRNDDSSLTNSRTTYRAGVEYDLAPQSLFYATVESGYRSGGFSPAAGFETYAPEFITAYTIGLKNRFLNNRLQLNLEAFRWDYQDQQVSHVGLDTNGRTANFTQNIGSSRIQGVEVDTRYLLTPATLLTADVQYLDAKDESFVYQQGIFGNPLPPLTGCPFSSAGGFLYNIDCSGKPVFNSPEWTINLGAQQTFDFGDFNLVLSANTQYKSERYAGFAYLPEQLLDPSWYSTAQAQWGPSDDRWSIAAYVRNIEDDRVTSFSSTHPLGNILIAGTTPPRLYGIRLAARF